MRKIKKDELEILKKKAMSGNSRAQLELGDMYFDGFLVQTDFFEAVKWYKAAADNNNKLAKCYLANCIFFGLGTEKDEIRGLEMLKELADNGNVIAMVDLGTILFNDHYQVKANRQLGKQYLKMAVELEDIEAIHFYIDYLIDEENYEEASIYLERLIEEDEYIEYYVYLAVGTYLINKTEKEKFNKGVKYLKKIAESGIDDAKVVLWELYLQNKELNIKKEQLEKYIYDAFENNHPDAVYYVVIDNINNVNSKISPQKLLELLKNSAENGSILSASTLGQMYMEYTNLEKAKYWYQKAASYGDLKSEYLYSSLILIEAQIPDKHIEKKEIEKAISLLEGAHSEGFSFATFVLYDFYNSRKNFNAIKRYPYLEAMQKIHNLTSYAKLINHYFEAGDYEETIKWVKKADNNHNNPGLTNMLLAEIYYRMGKFDLYDHYLLLAAEEGRVDALVLAAEKLIDKENPNHDFARARRYLKQALPDHRAYLLLGIIYTDGIGVKRNNARAVHYFNQARKAGNEVASEYLTLFRLNIFGFWVRAR